MDLRFLIHFCPSYLLSPSSSSPLAALLLLGYRKQDIYTLRQNQTYSVSKRREGILHSKLVLSVLNSLTDFPTQMHSLADL